MSTSIQVPQQAGSQNNSPFASVQVADASTKFSLYLEKLSSLQQPQPNENKPKCQKIVRLAFQTFFKYSQNQEFSKQSYELVKSYITNKRSYYSLYLMDLMIKNNKYVIKIAKRQVQTMMKTIWQKVAAQKNNEDKIQNLKIMVRCWAYIYSEKVEENIRKWLESKYSIKKLQLSEENQKAIKEIYGDKKQAEGGKLSNNSDRENKISQALLSSLVDDDNVGSYGPGINNLGSFSDFSSSQKLINNTQLFNQSLSTSFPNRSDNRIPNKTEVLTNIPKKSGSSLIANNPSKEQLPIKKTKLEGVNKSLLQALDLQ